MPPKDWTGNSKALFSTLGASAHSEDDRDYYDYYATHPNCATDLDRLGLIKKEVGIWECAAGEGHLSDRLKELGYKVYATDLVKRSNNNVAAPFNFLTADEYWGGDIVTNPPYNKATDFVLKALRCVEVGSQVIMFLKLTFLEGQDRHEQLFSKYPPKSVHVYSSRQMCAKNGDFIGAGSSAVCYAWFVWERGWRGTTSVSWITPPADTAEQIELI